MYHDCSKNVCLICNGSINVSTRKLFPIFEHRLTTTDRLVVTVMSAILGLNFKLGTVSSDAICRKCFKVFDELDELEGRVTDIKTRIYNDYHRTR